MIRIYVATAGLACLCVGAFGVRAGEETPAAVLALSSSCLIGGTTGGHWTKAIDLAARLKGGERYRLYGLKGFIGEATGAKPDPPGPEDEPCADMRTVQIDPAPNKDASLAISGQWNALPRPVQILSNSIGTYRDALRRVLAQNGIQSSGAAPDQTLRADLDGDGTMEILIAASKHAGGDGTPAKAGDFSVVLLQKIVNGAVQSIPVLSQYHQSERDTTPVEQYRIIGVLDVDGDGKMEIAVHGHYHEGDWTTIYSVAGDKVQEVATCGCSV
jgi:hypothetical protein